MGEPIRLWTCSVHHAGFRCGGWASLRVGQGQVTGAGGGERATTAERMALSGLAWALGALSPGAGDVIAIHTASADPASLNDRLTIRAAPDENRDLWVQILAAAKGWRLSLTRVALSPDTPIAFAAAWADLAMDKAKAGGAFIAAIPKSNLAKVKGLATS